MKTEKRKKQRPHWIMRKLEGDKENIETLAKKLNVTESEAVRRAVKFALENMKKES